MKARINNSLAFTSQSLAIAYAVIAQVDSKSYRLFEFNFQEESIYPADECENLTFETAVVQTKKIDDVSLVAFVKNGVLYWTSDFELI